MTYDARAHSRYDYGSPANSGGETYRGRGGSFATRGSKNYEASGYGSSYARDPYDVRGLVDVSDRPPRQQQDEASRSTTPRIPLVQRAESSKENDGLLSPRRLSQQVGAFGQMCEAGADWTSALVAALQGHKMTEEQAAICLQSHWRRHEAAVSVVARNLAATHIQYAWRERLWIREGEAAAALAVASSPVEATRAAAQLRFAKRQAATRINAAWRGHLARVRVKALREKKSRGSIIKRSLSFGKKKKPSEAATPSKTHEDSWKGTKHKPRAQEVAETSKPESSSLAKKVRRSLSFDRKSSESKAAATISATRRTFVLERGPTGLGLELDATNTVVTIKPGGRAERQGLLALGDTILTIDGKSCAGTLMQDVMVPGRQVYVVEVSRPERAMYAPTPAKSAIRRSLSFDSKKSGGVRRSFSFTSKR